MPSRQWYPLVKLPPGQRMAEGRELADVLQGFRVVDALHAVDGKQGRLVEVHAAFAGGEQHEPRHAEPLQVALPGGAAQIQFDLVRGPFAGHGHVLCGPFGERRAHADSALDARPETQAEARDPVVRQSQALRDSRRGPFAHLYALRLFGVDTVPGGGPGRRARIRIRLPRIRYAGCRGHGENHPRLVLAFLRVPGLERRVHQVLLVDSRRHVSPVLFVVAAEELRIELPRRDALEIDGHGRIGFGGRGGRRQEQQSERLLTAPPTSSIAPDRSAFG